MGRPGTADRLADRVGIPVELGLPLAVRLPARRHAEGVGVRREQTLAVLGADADHEGARLVLPDDEPVVMVEVVNSTAEPDGTFRTYWLRVPPSTRTAREGVAWTFGVAEEEYRPERET